MDFQIIFSIDNLSYKTLKLKVFLKKGAFFLTDVDIFIDFFVIEKKLKMLKILKNLFVTGLCLF